MFDDPAARRRRRILMVVGLLAVLVAGGLVGRVTAPDGIRATTAGPGGVQVGFPATPSGARAAALEFTTARLRAILLPAETRRAMLERIGTAEFVRQAERQDVGVDLSAAGADPDGLRLLTTGLGTMLERYAGQRARVVVWAMRALGGVALPVASFTTQVVDLRWGGEDWQVTGMRDATRQAVPRVLQTGGKTATNAILRGLAPASYGTP